MNSTYIMLLQQRAMESYAAAKRAAEEKRLATTQVRKPTIRVSTEPALPYVSALPKRLSEAAS